MKFRYQQMPGVIKEKRCWLGYLRYSSFR